MEYCLVNKIEVFSLTATWIDLEDIRLWKKLDRERQILYYDVTYMWNQKVQPASDYKTMYVNAYKTVKHYSIWRTFHSSFLNFKIKKNLRKKFII